MTRPNAPPRHGSRRLTRGALWLWLAPAGLAGCGAPPPPPPTVIQATIAAAAGVNGGAPVALRIYQLVSPAGFQGAQFFPVFEKDKATLKDDLVKRDDVLLAPGGSKTLTLMPEDRAHAIGVFGAYRDYEHVAWQAVIDIPAHQTSTLTVTAGPAGVTAAIEATKPAK